MIGYDLLTQFRLLTPYQQDLCIQWFMGGVSMDYEGFRDSSSRPNYSAAKYTAEQFKASIGYAKLQPQTAADDLAQQLTGKTMPRSNPLDSSYNRFCLVCGVAKIHHTNTTECCTQCRQDRGTVYCDAHIAKCVREKCLRPMFDHDTNQVKTVLWPDMTPNPSPQNVHESQSEIIDKILKKPNAVDPAEPGADRTVIGIIEFAEGKVASSKCPAFHLIPTVALLRLVQRFELGQERKKDKAWNATTDQSVLLDRAWVMERLNHVIKHALDLRDKLSRNDLAAIESEDDAAAIMWAGAFLCAATDAACGTRSSDSLRSSSELRSAKGFSNVEVPVSSSGVSGNSVRLDQSGHATNPEFSDCLKAIPSVSELSQ